MEDAKVAVECGVDGVDVVIGTSKQLREHSHKKSMDEIKESAIEVIQYIKSKGVEVRFSSEDSFRSNLVDLLSLYQAVDVSPPLILRKQLLLFSSNLTIDHSKRVVTVWESPTRLVALPPARCTSWCGLSEALSDATSRHM
jgi:hypothetical protein